MARISSKGFVDDGRSGLDVAGNVEVAGRVSAAYSAVNSVTVAGSGSVTFSTPGLYVISAGGTVGAGDFTGSVPAASSYPGATLMVRDTLGTFPYMLTGSATGGTAVFSRGSSGSFGVATQLAGTVVTATPKCSLMMVSDGLRWMIAAHSGSYTLSGLNL